MVYKDITLTDFIDFGLAELVIRHNKDRLQVIEYDPIFHPHLYKFFSKKDVKDKIDVHFMTSGAFSYSDDVSKAMSLLFQSGFFTRVSPYNGCIYVRKPEDIEEVISNEIEKISKKHPTFENILNPFVDHLEPLVVNSPYSVYIEDLKDIFKSNLLKLKSIK